MNTNKNQLVGGVALDVLGLGLAIQYTSMLLSAKLYYLLSIFPIWGGWTAYQTVKGGAGGLLGGNDAAGATAPQSRGDDGGSGAGNRKQRRAEQRKQR